jgi:hypothetical protein
MRSPDDREGEADEAIDQENAGTLDEPREDDEGGEEQTDSVPDA